MLSPLHWRNWDWEGIDQFSQLLLQSFVRSLRKINTKRRILEAECNMSPVMHPAWRKHDAQRDTQREYYRKCFRETFSLSNGFIQRMKTIITLLLVLVTWFFLEEDKHEGIKIKPFVFFLKKTGIFYLKWDSVLIYTFCVCVKSLFQSFECFFQHGGWERGGVVEILTVFNSERKPQKKVSRFLHLPCHFRHPPSLTPSHF